LVVPQVLRRNPPVAVAAVEGSSELSIIVFFDFLDRSLWSLSGKLVD
jgi:hypothetical protein